MTTQNTNFDTILDQIQARNAAAHGLFIRSTRTALTKAGKQLLSRQAGESTRTNVIRSVVATQDAGLLQQMEGFLRQSAKLAGVQLPGAPKQLKGEGTTDDGNKDTSAPKPEKVVDTKGRTPHQQMMATFGHLQGSFRDGGYTVDMLMASSSGIKAAVAKFGITLEIDESGAMRPDEAFVRGIFKLLEALRNKKVLSDDIERREVMHAIIEELQVYKHMPKAVLKDLALRSTAGMAGLQKELTVVGSTPSMDLPEPPRPPRKPFVSGPAAKTPVMTAEQAASVQTTPDPLDAVYDTVVAAIETRTEGNCPRVWLRSLDGVNGDNVKAICERLDTNGITKLVPGKGRLIIRS